MFHKDELPSASLKKITDLVRCTGNNMPSLNVSLELFCHVEGLMTEMKKFWAKGSNDATLRKEMLAKINKAIQEEQKPDIKALLRKARKALKEGVQLINGIDKLEKQLNAENAVVAEEEKGD